MNFTGGPEARRTRDPFRGGAAIAALLLLGIASCANTQISASTVESAVIQILGIAFLVWLALLIA